MNEEITQLQLNNNKKLTQLPIVNVYNEYGY